MIGVKTMQEIKEFEYKEEGVVNQTIGAMIALFVGLGVVALVVILVGVLSGKAYNTVEADISALADVNAESGATISGNPIIEQDINNAIHHGFSSFNDGVAFLPIIVLALVFFLVLALLATGMRPFSGGASAI